ELGLDALAQSGTHLLLGDLPVGLACPAVPHVTPIVQGEAVLVAAAGVRVEPGEAVWVVGGLSGLVGVHGLGRGRRHTLPPLLKDLAASSRSSRSSGLIVGISVRPGPPTWTYVALLAWHLGGDPGASA